MRLKNLYQRPHLQNIFRFPVYDVQKIYIYVWRESTVMSDDIVGLAVLLCAFDLHVVSLGRKLQAIVYNFLLTEGKQTFTRK